MEHQCKYLQPAIIKQAHNTSESNSDQAQTYSITRSNCANFWNDDARKRATPTAWYLIAPNPGTKHAHAFPKDSPMQTDAGQREDEWMSHWKKFKRCCKKYRLRPGQWWKWCGRHTAIRIGLKSSEWWRATFDFIVRTLHPTIRRQNTRFRRECWNAVMASCNSHWIQINLALAWGSQKHCLRCYSTSLQSY